MWHQGTYLQNGNRLKDTENRQDLFWPSPTSLLPPALRVPVRCHLPRTSIDAALEEAAFKHPPNWQNWSSFSMISFWVRRGSFRNCRVLTKTQRSKWACWPCFLANSVDKNMPLEKFSLRLFVMWTKSNHSLHFVAQGCVFQPSKMI